MNKFLEIFFPVCLAVLLILSSQNSGYIGNVSVLNVGAYIIAPVLGVIAISDIKQKNIAGWAYLAVGIGIFLMMINEFVI